MSVYYLFFVVGTLYLESTISIKRHRFSGTKPKRAMIEVHG